MSKNIIEYIAENAQRDAEKVALIFPELEKSVTYQELLKEVYTLAQYMQKFGIDQKQCVILQCSDPYRYVLSVLAVGVLGCAVLPLDPNKDKQEVIDLIRFLDVNYVINESDNTMFSDSSVRTICVGDDPWQITQENDLSEKLMGTFSADDDFILLNTSGSTGKPKVVRMHHKGYIHNAQAVSQYLKLSQDTRFLSLTPLYHSHGIYNGVLLPLIMGASSVVIKEFSVFQAFKIWEYVKEYSVHVINIVPTIIEMLLEMNAMPGTEQIDSLKFSLCGTAALREEKRMLFEERSKIKTICQYGLSETLINFIEPLDGPRVEASVGKPVGCEIHIDESQDMGETSIGEIIIQTPSIMNGYYGEDKEYSKGFFTGDLGYLDENGYLFIKGRKKNIIIKGGKNIVADYIDQKILSHSEVKEVVTLGIEDSFYGEEIFSFVVREKKSNINEVELLHWCRSNISEESVPKQICFVEEIPKGPTGKVLRQSFKKQFLEK